MRKACAAGLSLLVASMGESDARADALAAADAAEDSAAAPAPIIIYGRAENLIGIADAASEGHVGRADFETRPLQRVGELLEVIPGLIATQHSGSGKANQYFLRGFNLDHGTDFAAFLDGVPLNFRSHGHGQGYLDLNPIIPETIEYIDYRKGPYRADVGDFATAGAGFFRTYDELTPFASATIGAHNYYRLLAGGSFKLGEGRALAVVEARTDDTAYDLKQKLKHFNAFGKWTGPLGGGTLRASLNAYHATFNSTDQVPVRAIEAGLIDRLGFIDPTDGGATTRIGLSANWTQDGDNPLHILGYAHHYDFKLYSNFTYFLDNPADGDQFEQVDERTVFGGRIDKSFAFNVAGLPAELLGGIETRYDDIPRVGLYHTLARTVTGTVRQDRVKELSGAGFVDATVHLTPRLRLLLGLRADYYRFDVQADLPVNSGARSASIFSPKAGLAWQPAEFVELYGNYGRGFHSNDARGTVIQLDPSTGQPVAQVDPLVRSAGEEIGIRLRPVSGLSLTATWWRLRLASELLFIGDGGTTEAQGPSRRSGTEFALFYQPADWLTIDGEYTWSRARFTDQLPGEDYVPGAIESVIAGGIVVQTHGITASLRLRHFGSFAVIEDNSQRSTPTTVVNTRLAYAWGRFTLAGEVLNLLDSKDNDITYYYTSRLPGEPAGGVDDFHIHPIEPRAVRLTGTLRF